MESFQGELTKRILCWPKHHSNTAATLAVGLHSVKSKVLEAKLSFLQKILDRGSECVSGRVVEAMEGRLEDLCLVKECRELEEAFGVKLTDSIISEDERWGPVMKTMLRQKDRERHVARCKEKAPLIARIEKEIGWKKLWSDLLEYRKKTTIGLQSLSRLMSHHGQGNKPCPHCDQIPNSVSLSAHYVDLAEHTIFELLQDPQKLNFLSRFAWTFK